MISTFLLLLATTNDATAGDLQAGWRGVPFGSVSALDVKPGDDCDEDPEDGVRWRCRRTVGAAATVETYLVDLDLYRAFSVGATGFTDCSVLLGALNAAWGTYSPKEYATGPLADGFWGIGRRVSAAWSWNRFSGECYALAFDNDLAKKSAERARAKAAKDAESL
jgi:hypothetical protein